MHKSTIGVTIFKDCIGEGIDAHELAELTASALREVYPLAEIEVNVADFYNSNTALTTSHDLEDEAGWIKQICEQTWETLCSKNTEPTEEELTQYLDDAWTDWSDSPEAVGEGEDWRRFVRTFAEYAPQLCEIWDKQEALEKR